MAGPTAFYTYFNISQSDWTYQSTERVCQNGYMSESNLYQVKRKLHDDGDSYVYHTVEAYALERVSQNAWSYGIQTNGSVSFSYFSNWMYQEKSNSVTEFEIEVGPVTSQDSFGGQKVKNGYTKLYIGPGDYSGLLPSNG